MIKLYGIVFISELLAFYSFIMIGIKDSNSYIGLSFLGVYFTTKYSLKIREKGVVKSIYFSILVLSCFFLMYIFILKQYNVPFINSETLWFLMFVGLTIYQDYMFRTYSLDKLRNIYKS